MINYEFDASKYDKNGYGLIPAGQHRVRIEEASESVSKSGFDMVKLVLSVPGYSGKIFHYLVVNDAHMEIVHQKFGEVFDSFAITPGDMDLNHWRGKTGAARVRHGEYKGEAKAEVARFLSRRQQEELGLSADTEYKSIRDEFAEDTSDCPF